MGVLLTVVVLVAGGAGVYQYARSYDIYRGYAPPSEPAYTTSVVPGSARLVPVVRGRIEQLFIAAPSLNGYRVHTEVFLPPGYASHPNERYPVLYFLHGLHSQGFTWLTVLGGAVDEDVLVAKGRLKPMLIVIPGGPSRADTEWANGKAGAWDTFVAVDLVDAIDARFRTIPKAGARILAGLSEGGYGALNVGLHHPDTFGVLESWSGYAVADPTSGAFPNDRADLAYNSPLDYLNVVAPELRRLHTYIWFYIGNEDGFLSQNVSFSRALNRNGIHHLFFTARGGHLWRLWRRYMLPALLAASDHLHGNLA